MQQVEMAKIYRKKRCLVVDDMSEVRGSITRMLRSFGVQEIDTAANGDQAIEKCENHQYDIVVCDYNLGSGKGTSVKDVIAMAQKVTGKEIKTQVGVPRSGDPAILVADATRAHNRLRWKPEVTDVEQMIASVWKWREHKGSTNRAFSQKKPNPFL